MNILYYNIRSQQAEKCSNIDFRKVYNFVGGKYTNYFKRGLDGSTEWQINTNL